MPIVTTTTSAQAWSPDLYTVEAQSAVPGALLLQTSTVQGRIEGDSPAVRVAYADSDSAAIVPEGTELVDEEPTLSEVLVFTSKWGRLSTISREQWLNVSTPSQLANVFAKDITRALDEQYLVGTAPVPPAVAPPAGLVSLAGTVGGEVTSNLDPVIDLIAELEEAGAQPSHILLSPSGWARILKLKTAVDSNAMLLGGGVTSVERSLFSIPVLVNAALPAGTGLVVDRSAIVSATGPLVVANSEHSAFAFDAIQLRATIRCGWNVMRSERLGRFSIAAPVTP